LNSLLVSIILSVCPGYDTDSKGQAITNECQESLTNCAVGKHGKVTEETIYKCLEEYRRQQDEIDESRSSKAK
jgi:hypothetical protein